MTFNTTWDDIVLDQLADIYVSLDPGSRELLVQEIELLNLRLANDPYDVGESRAGNVRITFAARLTVFFTVNNSLRIVRVIAISKSGW